MVYYSIDPGKDIINESYLLFKRDEEGLYYSCSRSKPEWEIDSIFGVASSEKWLEKITEEQASQIQEFFRRIK